MKISVDRSRCEGYGFCESKAPSLLHLDDDGELVIDQPTVPADLAESVTAAVRSCPVAALSLDG
ncbi:ferredoxin [Streptomyces sp. NPDC059224]|uniref:ferredoxin n=1 Tax=Streptomyces sp. NPDC059224 TaxID=3346775 RepID=UPI00369F1397